MDIKKKSYLTMLLLLSLVMQQSYFSYARSESDWFKNLTGSQSSKTTSKLTLSKLSWVNQLNLKEQPALINSPVISSPPSHQETKSFLPMQISNPIGNQQENPFKTLSDFDSKTPINVLSKYEPSLSGDSPESLNGTISLNSPFLGFDSQKTISLSLREADIREVLREIAREGSKNIVLDKSVKGTISADLLDMDLNAAMDVVLTMGELEARNLNSTILVASRGAMQRKNVNRSYMKTFKLNNANAVDVASILNASVFNSGIEVKSSVEAKDESNPAAGFQAVQPNTSNGPNYWSTFPGGGSGAAETDSSDPPNQTASAQGGSATSSSSIASAANKTVRASLPELTSASGFNEGAGLASDISIQSYINTTGAFEVDNNNGGAIVIPETRSNSVLVVGTHKDIMVAERVINRLDKKLEQVNIDVTLIEMSKNDAMEFGIKLGGGAENVLAGFNTPNAAGNSNFVTPGPIYEPGGNVGETDPTRPFNRMFDPTSFRQRVGLGTSPGGATIGITTIENISRNFVASLNTLLTNNKAKLLANPNVLVLDGTEALVKITDQIISRTTVTVTEIGIQTDVELADVGVVLNILPKIGDDETITMKIRPSVTTPLGSPITLNNITVTLISTREVILQDTRVKNGETLVLAGLINESELRAATKIPFLGDLPIFGTFFRTNNDNKTKKELVIMITPKIVEI